MDMIRWIMLNPRDRDFKDVLRSHVLGGLPTVPLVVVLSESECVVWGTDGSVRTWNHQKWREGDFS